MDGPPGTPSPLDGVLHITNVCKRYRRLAALSGVDRSQLEPAASEIEGLTADKPKRYQDWRELLDQQKPEIVIVGTPDHWHPLITIAAVQNGAHVYVEKPVGHTILEGRAMVKAARDAGKVVQVGTHRRVSPHNATSVQNSSAPSLRPAVEPTLTSVCAR